MFELRSKIVLNEPEMKMILGIWRTNLESVRYLKF